ncbi:NFU1 iron-sulfur cluster scaffold [Perkinsus olseni]|uniref:NFU1 iron-sulfur cluster scaffold n=1 Tax=Perkinsus olseni TaxID=32597 RepID=A0A7J6MCP3_PEROL|nr:NFU1 iron-sulfur cluster scaffold [Perkinsus olseni]KAF4669325.1 NFU1 iron-sulfur cluster scaffold [Perkinsus olseni]
MRPSLRLLCRIAPPRVVLESTPNPLAVMYTSEAFKKGDTPTGGRRSATYMRDSNTCPRVARELLEVEGVDKIMLGDGFLSIVASRRSEQGIAFDDAQLATFQSILDRAAVDPDDFFDGLEFEGTSLPSNAGSEVERRIQALLDERIRPVIAQDGGDCEFIGFDPQTGMVTLTLHGSCEGCPQSAKTLKDSIERTLRFYVPEVKSVEQAVSEEDVEAQSPYIHHNHEGGRLTEAEKEELAANTPLFSTFAGATINERMVLGWGLGPRAHFL